MKIRTIKYMIKEGAKNLRKNRLMTLASVSTVMASLAIFGIFYLMIINFSYNIEGLKDQPEIQVFLYPYLDDEYVAQVDTLLRNHEKIDKITLVSKEDAFKKVQEMLGSNSDVLEGMGNSFLPLSYIIKLNDPEESDSLVEEIRHIQGVDTVAYPKKTVEFISALSRGIKIMSSFLTVILLVVSIFIISNTTKLTVYARRREIGIMKYVGATNWFIRWPFIVEGMLIGIIGSLLSFALCAYGYELVENKVTTELVFSGMEIISLLKLTDFLVPFFLIFAFLGCTVGAFGSIISIRKHLKV